MTLICHSEEDDMKTGEILIGDNKFVYNGDELRIYNVMWPNEEIVLTKQEVKDIVAYNNFMSEVCDERNS